MEKKHAFIEKETGRLRLADVANLLRNWEAEVRGEGEEDEGVSFEPPESALFMSGH